MAGGALGSLARWLVAEWIAAMPWAAGFPFGTLLVNVAGSFGIGILSELLLEGRIWHAIPSVHAFVFVGIFGGFTTFSAFSLQTLALLRTGQVVLGGVNILASVAVCLFAVWLGAVMAHWLAN